MKNIPSLLDACPTENLQLAESGDVCRLRDPVLSLESNGTPIVFASGWGGPRRRQEAENALTLFKLLIEKESEVTSDDDLPAVDVEAIEAERDVLKQQVADLQSALEAAEAENVDDAPNDQVAHIEALEAALDTILSDGVTSAKKAKEVAAGVRG